MPTETENLLKAEEAVTQLLGRLERLKQESENYTSARNHLDNVQRGLSNATLELRSLADASKMVIGQLAQIGTPELLERMSTVQRNQAIVGDSVDRLAKDVAAISTTAGQNAKDTAEGFKTFERELKSLRDRIDAASTSASSVAEAASSRMVALDSTLARRSRTQNLILALVLLLLIGMLVLQIPAVRTSIGG